MAIDSVKIPQNVYIEDRIVGPLTLRQTLMIALGGGFSYALWAMLNKAYGSLSVSVTILVWLPAVIAVAFAFVKINDLSLMRILLLLFERIRKPAVRTWAPRRGIMITIRTSAHKTDEQKVEEQKKQDAAQQQKQEKIRELSAILDAGMQQETPPSVEDMTPPPSPSPTLPPPPVLTKETPEEDHTPSWKRPVDPTKISVDQGEHPYGLNDLSTSVFRDLFHS